jgi:hypothetical protein
MHDVSVPFSLRGEVGEVLVRVFPNEDPVRFGCNVLDSTVPVDVARGFPICEATPVVDLDGYAGACGWIQLVRSTDGSGEFELDPLSLFRDVDTPFAFFGIRPMLFDAPFRDSRYPLSWKAHAFLCAVPDGVLSKVVEPVAGFEWGFEVAADAISIDRPRSLEPTVWTEHVAQLEASFPRWDFATAPADDVSVPL